MEREERLLAMNGGNVNETLFDICEEGGGKDVRFLLAHGADVNSYKGGWAVLLRAARCGHLAVMEALLDAGAGYLGAALVQAAVEGHTAVVSLLLDRGADVHYDGDWPLWTAVGNNRVETASLLLDRGANPNANPSDRPTLGHGMTNLKGARERGPHEMVALLLERGAIDDAA